MKFYLLTTLLIISTLSFSCGSDFSLNQNTTYQGKLVLEDGVKFVSLVLLADGSAQLKGLYPNLAKGSWTSEATGLGYEKDGVKATFDGVKEKESYRIVFMLQPTDEGLVLADIRVRLLKDKPSMLQSLTLKEKKPLLSRVE